MEPETLRGQPVRSHAYWASGSHTTSERFGARATAQSSSAANEPTEGRTAHAFCHELDTSGSVGSLLLDTYSTTRPGLASLRTKVRSQLRGTSDFRAQGRAPFEPDMGFKKDLPLFSIGPDPYRVSENSLWDAAPPGSYVEIGQRKRTEAYVREQAPGRGGQLDTVDNKPWHPLESKASCISPARSDPRRPAPGTERYRGKHRIPEAPRVFNKEFTAFNWGCQSRVHRGSPTLRSFFRNSVSPFRSD